MISINGRLIFVAIPKNLLTKVQTAFFFLGFMVYLSYIFKGLRGP